MAKEYSDLLKLKLKDNMHAEVLRVINSFEKWCRTVLFTTKTTELKSMLEINKPFYQLCHN